MKLSLKKQIWSGINTNYNNSSSTDNSCEKVYQPLSWGLSVVNKKKNSKPDANEELLAYDFKLKSIYF